MSGMRRVLVLSVSSVLAFCSQSASYVLFQCMCGVCAECCICPISVYMWGMRRVLYLSCFSGYAGGRRVLVLFVSSVHVGYAQSSVFILFQHFCRVAEEYLICLFSVLLPDSRRVLFICFFSVSAVYPKSTDFVVF